MRIVGELWEPGQPGQLYMPLATLQTALGTLTRLLEHYRDLT